MQNHRGIIRLYRGDSLELLKDIEEGSIGALISDPPYGLEFMEGVAASWRSGAGMSKPGIGARAIPWVSYGWGQKFGGANPTCAICGGRVRGTRKCNCEEPDWRVSGEPVNDTEVADSKRRFQAWCALWLRECSRILQPGGVAKIFGAPRMFHRMAAAMEEAGFTIIGQEAWGYSTGFPKSRNLSLDVDRILGNKREGIAQEERMDEPNNCGFMSRERGRMKTTREITRPLSPEGTEFAGWGNALKPSWEPFIIGRKPE